MGRSVSLLYKDIFITFQDVSKTAHFDRCNVSYGCTNVSDRYVILASYHAVWAVF